MTSGKGGRTVANNVINLDYLKKYMEKKDITEVKLAKIIGVDYTTVYRVFKGDRNPGVKFISGLLNSSLDLEYDEIFLNKQLPDGNKNKGQTA